MAIRLNQGEENPKRFRDAIEQLNNGRGDFVGDVTLRAGQTTTTVNFANCSTGCRVFLQPKTANAAAALATTYIKAADILQGSFVVTHANAGTTDRTFSFETVGG